MRVLMVSKACIVGQYQTKLEALASHPNLDLTVVVPPFWKDERGVVPLERAHLKGYRLIVAPMALQGHFHTHYYPTLGQILRATRPEIVHVDEEPYNLATFLALRGASHLKTKALFFTWQNLPRRYPPPFSWFEAYCYAHSNCAVAGTAEAARVLASKGFRAPIHVIPQFGVDPDVFAPIRDEDANRPFTIGFVGRLVEEKGAQVLLTAVAGLDGVWALRLLGSGPIENQLRAAAGESGIKHRVHFESPRPSLQMPDFYRQLDVLVLPSLTRPNWKEQFGRVLIEAMSCGVAVIGSRCGEIPNIIGDAGLVFPEGDDGALAAHLHSLQCDRNLATDLGRRGRARVLKSYTQEQVADSTFSVYSRLVAGAAD